MTLETKHQSEVADLLKQIETEYLASRQGLTGFAESGRHAVITARMENLGRLHENLRSIVGDEAIRLIAERLEVSAGEER